MTLSFALGISDCFVICLLSQTNPPLYIGSLDRFCVVEQMSGLSGVSVSAGCWHWRHYSSGCALGSPLQQGGGGIFARRHVDQMGAHRLNDVSILVSIDAIKGGRDHSSNFNVSEMLCEAEARDIRNKTVAG